MCPFRYPIHPHPTTQPITATVAEVLKEVAEKQGWQPTDTLLRLEGELSSGTSRGRALSAWRGEGKENAKCLEDSGCM